MGFRFRRSIKIIPGIRLNFSKSGVSTSLSVRGAHVTLGHGQVRETVGLPGSGLSYTESQRVGESHAGGAAAPDAMDQAVEISLPAIVLVVLGVVGVYYLVSALR